MEIAQTYQPDIYFIQIKCKNSNQSIKLIKH